MYAANEEIRCASFIFCLTVSKLIKIDPVVTEIIKNTIVKTDNNNERNSNPFCLNWL